MCDEDTSVIVAPLANDTDVDDLAATLTLQSVGPSTIGTAVDQGNGTVLYTPSPNAFGADSFTYTVADPHGLVSVGTVTVTVHPINDPPTAVTDVLTILQNAATEILVLDNDIDVDPGELVVVSVTPPSHGTATINSQGDAILYQPESAFCDTDSFTYTLEDDAGVTATATVDLTVECVGFSLSAPPGVGTYEIGSGDGTIEAVVSIQEDVVNSSFPNPIEALECVLEFDSALLQIASVTPGAALGGPTGPTFFDVTVNADDSVTVTIEPATSLLADTPNELLLVECTPAASLAIGNPTGLATAFSIGVMSTVQLASTTVTPTSTLATQIWTPDPVGAGLFHFLAPGDLVQYDAATGIADVVQPVFVEEGAGGPSAINSFSMGLAYDATLLTAVDVAMGPALAALQGGTGPDFFQSAIVAGGWVVDVTSSFGAVDFVLAEPAAEVLTVTYETVASTLAGNVSGATVALNWVDTLGIPPVQNSLTVSATTHFPLQFAGAIELRPLP